MPRRGKRGAQGRINNDCTRRGGGSHLLRWWTRPSFEQVHARKRKLGIQNKSRGSRLDARARRIILIYGINLAVRIWILHRVRGLLGIYDNGGVLRARLLEEVRCVFRQDYMLMWRLSHVAYAPCEPMGHAELLRDSGGNRPARKNNARLIIEQHSGSIIISLESARGKTCSFVIWLSRREMIYGALCGFIANYFGDPVCRAWKFNLFSAALGFF